MKRCISKNTLTQGLIDYVDILQMSGLSDISLTVPEELQQLPVVQNNSEQAQQEDTNMAKRTEQTMPAGQIANNKTNDFGLDLLAEDRAETLQQLAVKVSRCKKCSELVDNRTQTVFGVGNPFAELVFLGEAPGADEDEQGIPFVGRAGKLLTDMIEKGMQLKRDDVYICNILRCRPPGNRNPSFEEAVQCRPFLDATLQVIRPKFICCLGAVAATNLLNSQETIGKMRGRIHDYRGIKVVCTYHPAYLLRNPSAKTATWDDLKLLMREMNLPVPQKGH